MNAFAPVRTGEPATPLISTADAKEHCRVDGSEEDSLIAGLVSAATSWLDGYAGQLGQALITQTWSQAFDGFPADDRLRLALGPLIDVTGVSYFDPAGAAQTFTGFTAISDAIGPMIVLDDDATWPQTAIRPDAVTVTWRCGYGTTPASVPAAIVHAAKLLIGQWYDDREGDVPPAVGRLIGPFRRIGL